MAVRTSFTAGEVLAAADLTDTFGAKANLASPTFTGTPAAPTAAAGTNTTQLATTAFVLANSGKVLQVVRATDATSRTTSSTTAVDANLSVTITPKASNSIILVISSNRVMAGNGDGINILLTDSSNNPLSGAEAANVSSSANNMQSQVVLIGYSTPATTSPVTYKQRFFSTGAQVATIRNNNLTGQMYAIEVSA